MATDKRKQYEVEVGGITHTFLLDEDDVARYKAAGRKVTEVKGTAPANKGRSTANKA